MYAAMCQMTSEKELSLQYFSKSIDRSRHQWINGWMGGWIDGWMDEWKGGWMDGKMD